MPRRSDDVLHLQGQAKALRVKINDMVQQEVEPGIVTETILEYGTKLEELIELVFQKSKGW